MASLATPSTSQVSGQIVQLEIQRISYFLWMEVFEWWSSDVLDGLRKLVSKSEMTPESARAHLQSFDRLQCNQVFKQATQEQVKNGVQLTKTFFFNTGRFSLTPPRASMGLDDSGWCDQACHAVTKIEAFEST